VWWPGLKNCPTVTHSYRKRRCQSALVDESGVIPSRHHHHHHGSPCSWITRGWTIGRWWPQFWDTVSPHHNQPINQSINRGLLTNSVAILSRLEWILNFSNFCPSRIILSHEADKSELKLTPFPPLDSHEDPVLSSKSECVCVCVCVCVCLSVCSRLTL
jgi:hypothetical protein